jgi:hypothetical protein
MATSADAPQRSFFTTGASPNRDGDRRRRTSSASGARPPWRVRVEPGTGVVEERVIGLGKGDEFVLQLGRVECACRPPRRGPVPRWVWFVVAYRASGDETVVPPTYLVIEDGTGALLGTRDAD